MSLVEGAAQFGARSQLGTPRVVPRERSPWGQQTSVILKKGHPVQSISGTQVSLMQIHTNATASYISGSKIYGFMAQDENAQHALDLPAGGAFATMPKLFYGNSFRGFENVQVYVADGITIFSIAVTSGAAITGLNVGLTYSLRWDTTLEQITLDTGNTAFALATIIGIRPGDEGANANGLSQVDFIIEDAVSSYLTGT